MKLSVEWLNEFVNLDIKSIGAREFSEAMSLSGSKVETYFNEAQKLENIVVGQILNITKHPDADKLTICEVDINNDDNIQIVTAATNVSIGDKVPVALHNSTLADGTKIKKSKLRGVESKGMFCSVAELGVTVNDFPEACEDGIFILKQDTELGIDIREALLLNDIIFDFEITSNRADCFSVIGLAREVAATFDKKLKLHKPIVKSSATSCEDLTVKVKAPELCPMYCAKLVKNIKIKPSPQWLRQRLRRMNIRPINNIVDITNYVMLEYGQPMHAFDLDKITNKQIIVRNAQAEEELRVLDGSKLKLTQDDLVIADAKNPIALAGVMGGENSGICNDTSSIVFESANFSPSSVRATSRKYGIRTDSSALFEKGLDPNNCICALERACELIEILDAGEVCSNTMICKNFNDSQTIIELEHEWINRFLNINLSKQQMIDILEKLGFRVENEKIIVPSFRLDIEGKADIAEEIARYYGYNNIKTTSLRGSNIGGYSCVQKFKNKLARTMQSLGADEVLTYSFISPKLYEKMLLDHDQALGSSVKIFNPLGEDTSVMRNFALPSILEVISRNYNNRNSEACIFEIAKEYIKKSDDVLPDEINKLIVAAYGQSTDFFSTKGIAEALLKEMNIDNFDVFAVENMPYYHPGRCAQFKLGEKILGYVAQVHPSVLSRFEIDQRVYTIYFDFELMYQNSKHEKFYKALPKFPAVVRDLAVICDVDKAAIELQKLIRQNCGKFLEDISIFDVYTGKQIEQGKKSIAFKITLRSNESTLTDKQVENIMNKVIKALDNIGAKLRLM